MKLLKLTAPLRHVHSLASGFRSFLLISWYRLLYPGFQSGAKTYLGRGVRIAVLNGATLEIGGRSVIEPNCQLVSHGYLAIGSNAFVGQGSVITAAAQLTIGSDALIASGVVIRDQDHGTGRPRRLQALVSSPVSIGQNVWIGANAVVLKGVKIGDNALIGAGAVVTRDIPADAVAVGVPAVILPDRRA